ncbi:LMBR1-like membrane protein-domain-containing protein [Ilyonectria robusta]|uniref:LMBR1-like membrane protein-domain-containing protein n=1 Tax=Ilyonectria robusta TaxID=1079257 RepID=UPI001E8D62AD|nr:LMBR1-like membrane protein-domain-containing protein [Ilyonectria robusta]KAH8737932.1 LMBR1-like membrane protein-domain-containing protein [Ilyonectria robusta]
MIQIASSSSPVGSEVFSLFALLLISLAVLLILRHYLPLRTTPAFYLVPIFFALWLPSIVIILVPVDLASSATPGDDATRGIWLPERVILVSWRITYWLTFALTWFILPVLAEYSDAGYREPKDKLLYSLRGNAQFQITALGFGSIGLIYVFYYCGFNFTAVKALVMALAYCWGLILAIYLMGHGLVSIPRRLMRSARISGRLRRLQSKAPKVYEQMEDSLMNLEDIEAQVAELGRRKVGSAMNFRDWIEELQEMANIPEAQPRAARFGGGAETAILPHVITEKYLADLTRKLTRAKHARSRYVNAWSQLVEEAAETQTILDSVASKKLEFDDASSPGGFWKKTTIFTPYTRYLYYYHVLPYAQILLGIFLAAASACIVWSEVVKVAFPKLSVIRLSVVHHWVGDRAEVGFAGQVISSFWICYMCAAALVSMTEVKVWRGRALVKRNTAHESAFWYAMQVAKLTIPLSYNFMTFLSKDVYKKTIFYKFLGNLIDMTPLGQYFDDLFPVVVCFPVLATLFGIYGKVKRLFVGMDVIDDDEENTSGYGTGSWREGRDLITRELGGSTILRRREEAIARLTSGGRSAPVLSIPSSSSPARSPARLPNNTRRAAHGPLWDDEPPQDDNLFQIIGHRMKNTMDGIETPKWMQDFGQGMKKPKWMGADDNAGGPSTSPGGTDFRRWFGGGSGEGQVRI